MLKYIGLCGHPGSGKTEVQLILESEFSVKPIDDGLCLREFAVDNLGLSWSDVTTAEGKNKTITVCGKEMTVRQFLGEYGNALEAKFGDHILPEIALKRCGDDRGPFSFGSVRKNQGWAYLNAGNAVIIEVTRPGVDMSGHWFDTFDPAAVTVTLANNGTLDLLRQKIQALYPLLVDRMDNLA